MMPGHLGLPTLDFNDPPASSLGIGKFSQPLHVAVAVDSGGVAITPIELERVTADHLEFPEDKRVGTMLDHGSNHSSQGVGLALANRARAGTAQHGELQIDFGAIGKRESQLIANDCGIFKNDCHLKTFTLSEFSVHSIGSFSEDCGTDAHMGRTFLNRNSKIPAHSHAQRGQLDIEFRLQGIPQLAKLREPGAG